MSRSIKNGGAGGNRTHVLLRSLAGLPSNLNQISPIKSNTPPDLTQARTIAYTRQAFSATSLVFCVAFSATPEYVPGEASDCERAARISRACGSTGHPFTAKVGTAHPREISGCGSSGFQRIHTLRACLSYPSRVSPYYKQSGPRLQALGLCFRVFLKLM